MQLHTSIIKTVRYITKKTEGSACAGEKYKICNIFYISVALFPNKIDQSIVAVSRAAAFVALTETAPLQF